MIEVFLDVEKIDGQKNEEKSGQDIEGKEFSPCSVHPVLNSMTILQEKSSLRK